MQFAINKDNFLKYYFISNLWFIFVFYLLLYLMTDFTSLNHPLLFQIMSFIFLSIIVFLLSSPIYFRAKKIIGGDKKLKTVMSSNLPSLLKSLKFLISLSLLVSLIDIICLVYRWLH